MELFYRKLGEGPPLVIVHGLYGASDNWLSVGKALSDKYTVYLIDQRNHGQSPHSDIHDYQSMLNDLVEFMDRHTLSRAIFIGHSMGGKSVMFLAEAYPERIDALIVIDVAPTPYDSDKHPSQALTHKKIMEGMMSVDFKRVNSREDVEHQLAKSIDSSRIRSFLLKNVSRSNEMGYHWKLNISTLRKSLPAVLEGLDADKYSGGEEITGFPVLFIRGEKSDYISDDNVQVIQQIFPVARITTIPGAGHWLHVEQPNLLVKTIRYFL